MGSRVRVSSKPPRIRKLSQTLEELLFFAKHIPSYLGLTGFDSKDNGYVSMQAHTSIALKTDVNLELAKIITLLLHN